MSLIDRFLTSFRGEDHGAAERPGLIQNNDGTVDVINPDGTRTQVGVGSGGITEITSDDNTVTIVDPSGPTVDLSAPGGSLPASVTVESNDGLTILPTDSTVPTMKLESPTPDDGAAILEVESGSSVDCYIDGYASFYGQGAQFTGADSSDWGLQFVLNLIPTAFTPNVLRIASVTGEKDHLFKNDGKIGFNNVTPVDQPVVPMTTPGIQDVIDALVALGLVAQHD